MLKRLLCLLSISVFCSITALGQVYQPGFLVKSNGDTLRGEIENAFWVESPTSIRFRPTPESASRAFKPRELRYVSFTEGRNFRYEGLPIDHAARSKVGSLPYENRPDIKVDSVLAEVLVEGAVSLVRVVLLDKPAHYVLLNSKRPPLDLSERKYLRQTVDKEWILTDGNNYRGQLGVYFGDCPAAHAVSQTAPFTAKGLTDVVQAYNEACGPARQRGRDLLAQAEPRRVVAFQGGLLAGARYNRIQGDQGTGAFNSAAGPCVDCETHPFAGLYAEVFQPSRTLAFYGEFSVSNFKSQATQYFEAAHSYATFDYKAWLGTARIGVRYFLPLPHEQKFIAGLGYDLNMVFNPTTIRSMPTGTNLQIQPNELSFASATLLPNVTVGWRAKRVTVSLDGQMYLSSESKRDFGSAYFGSNFSTRVGLSYRLGHSPDEKVEAVKAKK